MPRYYFHYQSAHGDMFDDVGVDLDDDFEAVGAGLAAVRELLELAMREREVLDLSGGFRIVNADEAQVIRLIAYVDHLTVL